MTPPTTPLLGSAEEYSIRLGCEMLINKSSRQYRCLAGWHKVFSEGVPSRRPLMVVEQDNHDPVQ